MIWLHNLIWPRCCNPFFRSSNPMSKPTNLWTMLTNSTRDIMEEKTSVKIQETITIISSSKDQISSSSRKLKEFLNNQFKTCLSLLLSLQLLIFKMRQWFLSVKCLFSKDISMILRKLFQLSEKIILTWEIRWDLQFMNILLELLDQKKLQKLLECWLSCLLNKFSNIWLNMKSFIKKFKKRMNISSRQVKPKNEKI